MCDIWKNTESREMPPSLVLDHLDEFEALGIEWVVFTGGEPLMHSGLFDMCAAVRSNGVRVTVLTSGLLVERRAPQIAKHVDDLIVSLDGPPAVHDEIRGVSGAFAALGDGISALKTLRPDFGVAARCTVQKLNHHRLLETVECAAGLGLKSVSFLAVDLVSPAFNRLLPWPETRRDVLALTPTEILALERQFEAMRGHPLLADSPGHLRAITARFQAYAGLVPHRAPRCNAPSVSAVVGVDGRLRPCFFHPPVANISAGLGAAINAPDAVRFRESLDYEANETCRHCVCPLFLADQ